MKPAKINHHLHLLREARRRVEDGSYPMICYALDDVMRELCNTLLSTQMQPWDEARSELSDVIANALFVHDVDTVNELMHMIGVEPAEPYTSEGYETYTNNMAHLARLAWLDKLIEEYGREQT